ncbi:MAG: group III truncated hemoglobin [Hyphomicrobiaceae bacterium]
MTHAPQPMAPGYSVGIDEEMIRALVHTFYARVRKDALLGPIFESAVDDWDVHLDKLCGFWSSVTLMTGRYKGAPMQVHANLPEISAHHFDRWLELFRSTAKEICPPRAAALFIDRAERIAQSLELGIALHRGRGLKLGERLTAEAGKTGADQ